MSRCPPTFGKCFTYVKTLQEGSDDTAEVVIAHDSSKNIPVVCKIFYRSSPNFDVIEQEIRVQRLQQHPNIARVFNVVFTDTLIIMINEFYKNGDLCSAIAHGSLNIKSRYQMYLQVIEAVETLHKQGISHLDIKPENVFIDDQNNARLSDFGCVETPTSMKRGFYPRGTVTFAAPEIFDCENVDHRPADVWSLGIFLYSIITMHLPWKKSDNDDDVVKEIREGNLQFPSRFPATALNIIKKCCVTDPKNRINIGQLKIMAKGLLENSQKMENMLK